MSQGDAYFGLHVDGSTAERELISGEGLYKREARKEGGGAVYGTL